MYQVGDSYLEVRELLVKAFASAWHCTDKTLTRDEYITSSISVVETLQITNEMIYGEEGMGLVEGEFQHMEDLLRADGAWVYYGVPKESFFLVTWMPDPQAAAEKVAALQEEPDSIACVVDLSESWRVREHF